MPEQMSSEATAPAFLMSGKKKEITLRFCTPTMNLKKLFPNKCLFASVIENLQFHDLESTAC